MRKVVLVTPLAKAIPFLEGYDYIGVDAGALRLIEQGINMIYAIGDFDSMDPEDLRVIKAHCDVFAFPIMKDETDSELAIQKAIKDGYDDIILYGALSNRLDHLLANLILICSKYPQVRLLDEKQCVKVLNEGEHLLNNEYIHVSFYALEKSCISLTGFLYPLDHRDVDVDDIFMTSNSFNDKQGRVSVHLGRLLCVMSNYA